MRGRTGQRLGNDNADQFESVAHAPNVRATIADKTIGLRAPVGSVCYLVTSNTKTFFRRTYCTTRRTVFSCHLLATETNTQTQMRRPRCGRRVRNGGLIITQELDSRAGLLLSSQQLHNPRHLRPEVGELRPRALLQLVKLLIWPNEFEEVILIVSKS